MRESLRARLVIWYAFVLAMVVVLYGGAVVYQSWRSLVAGVDAELNRYALDVAESLHPTGNGRYDLALPPDAVAYFDRREEGRPYYIIWTPSGEIVDRSEADLRAARDAAPAPGRREVRLQLAGGATVLVGREIADLHRAQRALVLNVVMAGVATLALAIVGGWFVAGRALAPIRRISQTARAMSAGDLDARIAVERTESELEQVASTLNEAFDRLRLAVAQERQFAADASHELRTPISVLRAETEWALGRDRSSAEYRGALAICRRAALRMQGTVERLLALVRSDGPQEPPDAAPVAILTLVDDVVRWLAPLAEERGVTLSVSGDPVTAAGDAEALREALVNVVANAIVYNKPGGRVFISLRRAGGRAQIEVVDTGIGIPAEALPRVFDRFFRVDKARSRDQGGSGLGLSIARAIVVAHGGEITCASEPGSGSVFVIALPELTTDPVLCSPASLP